MAELDTVMLYNPTNEDFTHNFNGEPYTVATKESKSFVKKVGFHLAKHLATKMIYDDVSEKDRKDPAKANQISQRLVYDNEFLRINLYKIFKDVNLVQGVIMSYPYKGWIGDMKTYEKFVAEQELKVEKASEPKSETKTEIKAETNK